MNNNIVTANHYLEEEGLIYLEDIKQVGIHISGLARLLDCNPQTVQNLLESLKDNQVLDAEVQTAGGIQGVKFILENAVIDVLESAAMSSRIKPETRQNAMNLYRRFALAGLKLVVMMQIAPEKLGIANPTPATAKLKSLLDLTHSQLYRLAVYLDAKDSGLSPSTELIDGIPPIFLTASPDAAWLAERKSHLKEKLEIRSAEAMMREIYGADEDDESLPELIDGLAEGIADLEADAKFKAPFDEFESRLRAISAGGANVAALPPMARVEVMKAGIRYDGLTYISPDLPIGSWVWISLAEQGADAIEWRKDSGEYGGEAICLELQGIDRKELILAASRKQKESIEASRATVKKIRASVAPFKDSIE
jgi:hypothetical protein